MKDTDYAYYAGIIDGEGSLKLYRRPTKNGIGKIYNCYHPVLEVCNTDIDLIYQMKKDFKDGYIYKDKMRKTATGKDRKPIARWKVQYQQLYKILKIIYPYFRVKAKKDVAREIIHYYETRKNKPRIKENKDKHEVE